MNDEGPYLEQNVSRLIRAAFGPEARPTPSMRQQTLRHLTDTLRAGRSRAEFPEGTLILLATSLLLMAVWLATSGLGTGLPAAMNALRAVTGALVLLNMVWLPVASVVIVARRRNA